MRKASLKHLTLKTVFLLALGSGKRHSKIHAWLYKNIRHQENWSQVSLYPSPSFLSNNQLAKEGPASVAPVVIPALAPSLDNSPKEDKSLCPVRALHYYLDRTRISVRAKPWSLCPSRRVFTRISSLLPSLPGSNKQSYFATSSQTKTPRTCIKSGLMMLGPLRLPKPFMEGFP